MQRQDKESRKKAPRSTPQDFQGEILGQLERYAPDPATLAGYARPDGSRLELDPISTARRVAHRLGPCGSFPRGRVTLTYPDGSAQHLGAHQCRARLCPRCGPRRGAEITREVTAALGILEGWGYTADRTRFATLTIPNTRNAAEGIQALSEAWHRTLATKTWGRLIAGGFRCFEVKPGKDGLWNVHLHAILYLWGPGVPYRLLREVWNTSARGVFNQRFDTLKTLARPRKGQSKAEAAARYLTKYLLKTEDMGATRNAPGGLPHLLAALDGRRLFSAFGVGAIARRIERHQKPAWTLGVERALTGYQRDGQAPIAATIETDWMGREPVPIPRPTAPWSIKDPHKDADQLEPNGGPWQVRTVAHRSPLEIHPWREIPQATRNTATEHASALETWLENPKARGPRPFRWSAWWRNLPKTWTKKAEALLGEHQTGHLGAALWSKVTCTADPGPADPQDPRHWLHQLAASIRTARRHLAARLVNVYSTEERARILANLPAHLTRAFVEPEPLWIPCP